MAKEKKVSKKKDKSKDLLKEELAEQEYEDYKRGEINWVDNKFYDSFDKLKGRSKKLWGHKEIFDGEDTKLFFLAHSLDKIKGNPQLIEKVVKRIPLIRSAIKKAKSKSNIVEIKDIELQSFYFFDERFDKRHDGFQKDCLALDFWMYRVINEEGKEYYLLAPGKLPNETCVFKGMAVELDDFAEMSRSMKLKSLSRLFFVKEFEPSVKILSKKELINLTQSKGIGEEDWFKFMGYHPFGTINRFPKDTELLHSSFILGGKKDGYPNHLMIKGPAGTRKSCGVIETKANKFAEDYPIIEGANSRPKCLSPSFKEKPANIGYIASCQRIGFVDELGKMIDFEANKHQTSTGNELGELNSLLDHKLRTVGSGNDNQCEVQATAKMLFVSNPCANESFLHELIGLMDITTMSRMIWWVQDTDEQEFVLSDKGVTSPPTPQQEYEGKRKKKKSILLKKCWGELLSRDEFLTLFDTCYSFTSEIDPKEVQKLVDTSVLLAKGKMRDVWRPRANHHIFLLVDGLCKHRCLFKDYDVSFIAKEEDYVAAQRILVRMVNAWDTDLQPGGSAW